jgi:hypothetical protein
MAHPGVIIVAREFLIQSMEDLADGIYGGSVAHPGVQTRSGLKRVAVALPSMSRTASDRVRLTHGNLITVFGEQGSSAETSDSRACMCASRVRSMLGSQAGRYRREDIDSKNTKHAYAGQPNSFTHLRALLVLHDRGILGPVN